MTDKQIIIDGVNVAECLELIFDYQLANRITGKYEHIKNVCELGDRGVEGYYLECKNNDFCPYKQLKRLEQKNEKLKQTLEEIREIAKFNQFYNPEDLLINGNIGQIQNLKMNEIYNKISEVLK